MMHEDDNNDDVEIVSNSLLVEGVENINNFQECINVTSVFKIDYGRKTFKKISPPNYFVCIKIKNDQTVNLVKDCHKSILINYPDFSKALVKLDTLHITLFAMHLKDLNHLEDLSDKFRSQKESIVSILNENLKIKLNSLNTFRNTVVYVDLIKDDHYEKLILLQNHLVNLFEKWGVDLSEKEFKPHVTLMKLSRSSHFRKKGIKKINPEIYSSWTEKGFGCELVDSIHLCNIREKQKDGFYQIESFVELIK